MEYSAVFSVSFKEYCTINDLTEAPKEMIDKWRQEVIYNYSKESPAKFVMQLFKIPKEYKNAIEYHQYSIEETGYIVDKDEKVLTVQMSLKITR